MQGRHRLSSVVERTRDRGTRRPPIARRSANALRGSHKCSPQSRLARREPRLPDRAARVGYLAHHNLWRASLGALPKRAARKRVPPTIGGALLAAPLRWWAANSALPEPDGASPRHGDELPNHARSDRHRAAHGKVGRAEHRLTDRGRHRIGAFDDLSPLPQKAKGGPCDPRRRPFPGSNPAPTRRRAARRPHS